jgi:uncharacterized membrane protein
MRESQAGDADMSDETVNALLAVYPNRSYADAAVTYLQRLDKSNLLHVDGVAIVAKDVNGKVTAEQVGALTEKRGAGRGAMIGAAVGLIFPPSIVSTSIVGAGIGGLVGRVKGRSDPHSALQSMGERVDRGHAGVIVIVGDAAVDEVVTRLTGYESLHRERVDPKTLIARDEIGIDAAAQESSESAGPSA